MVEVIKYPNRLINQSSPYLLQHAYNPVDWYPWGEEAFEEASREDKPVFLSIGYSTCHWCHVMAHESFEDEEVANLLNKSFIAVKVDREERPDVDAIYMPVCQAMTGQGGWPLTIIMTPDKRPFFAATYLPRDNNGRMAGLMELLPHITRLWREERDTILETGRNIYTWMQQEAQEQAEAGEISEAMLHQAYNYLTQSFDKQNGGFGNAPKFPVPHNLMFLLRYYFLSGKSKALNMVEKTLAAMYHGGIYDHIGFGFARYSTDNYWLIPHFEKMLYDNALLAMVYLEAYQVTGNVMYSRVAREVFDYVLREMTSPDGGFYSAEDADTEGEEGKYYLWTPEEVIKVLGPDDGKEFCTAYNITSGGNFAGKNIPNLIALEEPDHEVMELRKKLLDYRNKRVHPHKDDKILTSWNGLMIAALAIGARILGEAGYLEAASKNADFILEHMRNPDGRLLASLREGERGYPAYAGDYANFIWGLLELYQAGFDIKYLQYALELNRDLIKYFWDQRQGGMFIYGSDAEQLPVRPKDWFDAAMPAANSVAALNFIRLARLTGDEELESRAQMQLKAQAGVVRNVPGGSGFYLNAVFLALTTSREVVIVGNNDNNTVRDMITTLNDSFSPCTLMAWKDEKNRDVINSILPFAAEMEQQGGRATAYICENFTCRSPVNYLPDFNRVVQETEPLRYRGKSK